MFKLLISILSHNFRLSVHCVPQDVAHKMLWTTLESHTPLTERQTFISSLIKGPYLCGSHVLVVQPRTCTDVWVNNIIA